jgi:hypothetical protein
MLSLFCYVMHLMLAESLGLPEAEKMVKHSPRSLNEAQIHLVCHFLKPCLPKSCVVVFFLALSQVCLYIHKDIPHEILLHPTTERGQALNHLTMVRDHVCSPQAMTNVMTWD